MTGLVFSLSCVVYFALGSSRAAGIFLFTHLRNEERAVRSVIMSPPPL